MSAPLFFVDRLSAERPAARLTTEDTRHALRSLRLQDGDVIQVADGQGALGRGRIDGEEGGRALVRLEEVRRVLRRPPVLTVALAAPKGDRLSWAVQKLAEVGVDRLVLMRSGRSVRVWESGRAERVEARHRGIAREAAMQSRQPFVMEVAAGALLDQALDAGGAPCILLAQEGESRLAEVLPEDVREVRLLVGPEGGWTEDELAAARASGAVVATMGAPVLRSETAALVGATIALASYGRLG